MCEYCGDKTPEERDRLMADAESLAKRLKNLGHYYERASKGYIQHHGEDQEAMKAGKIAHSIVRRLVEDWI